jgi:23S rRNA pseudouridine955/2504/2580 synthase
MTKSMEKQGVTLGEAALPAEPRRSARHAVVTAEDAGMRLDRFLGRELAEVPRTRMFRLVRKGEVRVNGKRATIDQRLATGDDVRIPPVRVEVPAAVAATDAAPGAPVAPGRRSGRVPASMIEALRDAVIFQDDRLLAINKPAGMAVHGGSGLSFGVIEALRAARPEEADTLELVHRLDRDTSGVLLVARKTSVLRMLHASLREGDDFEKRYLALLAGSWQLGKKRIDAPLRTDLRVGGERTVKVDASGKPSSSAFAPVQFFGTLATLMEVSIDTGRTHQIRVHAAYAGHPVAGDSKYGDAAFNVRMRELGLKRMFLHASSLSFTWPDRGTPFSVSAPLPPELSSVIDSLSQLSRRASRGPRAAPARPRSREGRRER